MMYIMRRRFFGDKKHDGEGVLGRFASEDSGGVRPEGRESAGAIGTVLRELCLGAEDFLAAAADGADGAGGAAARFAEPGDGGSGSAVAPPVAGAAGPHAGGVAAGVRGSRGGALQYSASVATAPAYASAAKKKSPYAQEQDTPENRQRREAWQEQRQQIDSRLWAFVDARGASTGMTRG